MTRAVTSLVSIEWSKDELVKLIDVYEQKEILRNFRHPKRDMQEVALREVVLQFAEKGMLQLCKTRRFHRYCHHHSSCLPECSFCMTLMASKVSVTDSIFRKCNFLVFHQGHLLSTVRPA